LLPALTQMLPPRKPIPGHLRKTTKATDKLLKSELKKVHLSVLENVSEQTIQNCLQKELCFPSQSPAKKLLLIPPKEDETKAGICREIPELDC
ncbi:hypothetical protein Hamer_G005747, partial [Homarus americanus]